MSSIFPLPLIPAMRGTHAFRLARPLLAGALALVVCSPLAARAEAGFTLSPNGDRSLVLAPVALEAPAGAGEVTLRLDASLREEKNSHGAVSIEFAVREPKRLPAFHFDDFEGPDPATGSRKLAEFRVVGASGSERAVFAPAGWYAAEPAGAYVFALSALSKTPNSLPRRLIEKAARDGDALEVAITDSKDARLVLRARFAIAERRADFARLLAARP